MADDIVTRLQDTAYETDLCWEAADEIERLRAAGERLFIHLDAHYGMGAPAPAEIAAALQLWKEARRG